MKKVWTLRVLVALVIAAVLDGISTHIASPDLSHEANPVLIFSGRTWSNLVILKILGSLGPATALFIGLHILQSRCGRLVGLSGFRSVLSHLIFKRHVSLGEFLLGWPKDWVATIAVACLCIAIAPITGGVSAAILNLLKAFRSQTHLIAFWLGNGVLAMSIGMWLTYRFIDRQNKAEPPLSPSE